eukprot:s405_g27.t1
MDLDKVAVRSLQVLQQSLRANLFNWAGSQTILSGAADAWADATNAGLGGWFEFSTGLHWFHVPLRREDIPADWDFPQSMQRAISSLELLPQLALLLGARARGGSRLQISSRASSAVGQHGCGWLLGKRFGYQAAPGDSAQRGTASRQAQLYQCDGHGLGKADGCLVQLLQGMSRSGNRGNQPRGLIAFHKATTTCMETGVRKSERERRSGLYVWGGTHGTNYPTDMYRFDLCTKQWEYLITSGDCPCGRYRHQAMVKDDLMYIVGGSGINRYGDVWTFHFGTNVWRRVNCSGTDLSDGRYAHSAVLREGFIYLYGGNDTVRHDDLLQLDLETKIWSRVLVHGKDCPPGRDFHAAVLRKDSMVVFGGSNGMRL